MLNISVQELTERLFKSGEKINKVKLDLHELRLKIQKLDLERKELEKEIEKEEKKSTAAEQALILARGVSSKILRTRNSMLTKMEVTKSKNITIAEKEKLEAEIENVRKELHALCSHPFVYDRPGWQGTPFNEYEDRCPGTRYCVVCGFSEDTYKLRRADPLGLTVKYLYETLRPDRSRRVILNEPWTQRGIRVDIWISLGAALYPFEDEVEKILNS